jgi:hypothetical protein
MAESKTQRSMPARATTTQRRSAASRVKTAVERTAELSEEVAHSVEDGQRAAIEAVRKFVDAVDHTLPALPHGEGPSRRQEIIDSALEMAERLLHTQYDFIRALVDNVGKAVGRSDGELPYETPFHTDSPEYPPTHRNVYHDNSLCDYGKEIKREHRISGPGGRSRCDRCNTLASQDR